MSPLSSGLRHPALLLVLLVGLTGCLPYSCRRTPSRALLPADSLSRQVAETVAVDTLTEVWSTPGAEEHELAYPRTVRFAGEQLLVSDAERNSVFAFGADSTFEQEWSDAGLDVPYIAGVRGDTTVIFSPTAGHLDFVVDGRSVRQVPVPEDLPRDALRYAAATPSALYLKVLSENIDPYIARLDGAGGIAEQYALPGPYWQHAGLLRAWGDTLISLSGYRPVVGLLAPSGDRVDTLALHGFDSPMLARTRQFILGDADEPPLLTASAAPSGDHLFVLNMRPGWLRIDVFDRQGELQHRLVEPNPRERAGSDFYPIDLAVRRATDGTYEIAVASVKPRPRVTLYRWRPEWKSE